MGNKKTKQSGVEDFSSSVGSMNKNTPPGEGGVYSDPFATRYFSAGTISYSQIKRMYSDRTEFLSSVAPSYIPSKGVVPRFSLLGNLLDKIDGINFIPMNIDNQKKESRNRLKETQLVYKIGALEKELVVLTYFGTAHLCVSSTQSWEEIDVDGEFIVDMEVSEVNVFLITSEGNMYSFSTYNVWGQTGTNDKTSIDMHKSIKAKKVIIPEGVAAFGSAYSGYGHTYFVTVPDRRLFFAGNSGLAQYAKQLDNESDMLTPVEICSPLVKGKSVKLIASGYAYCIVVFEDDSGVVFGSNDYKQLGYVTPSKIYEPLPLNVPTQNKLKAVHAGQWVSMVCTEHNEVFITGNLGSAMMYEGWTKLDLSLYGINPSSLFDAYLIQNKVALLATEKFVILDGASKSEVLFSDVKFEKSSELLTKRNLKYRVYPSTISGGGTSVYNILFFEDDNNLRNHFIYKFNEKTDFCDVIIKTESDLEGLEEQFANLRTSV